MRRAAAILLVLTLLAGCGGDEVVGRVNGTDVHLSQIERLYDGAAISADDFRTALFRVMVVEAIRQRLAADFQEVVEAAAVEAHLAELREAVAASGMTVAGYLGVAGASDEMLRFNAEVLALRDAALDHLVVQPETVDRLFADPATLTTLCSKHILVASEEEAEEAMSRLAGGEEFSAVAGELTLDEQSADGDLGCVSAAALVPAYRDAAMAAEIGEVTGPVATDFGFHVIVVYERRTPTREQYLADPRAVLDDDALFDIWSGWFNGLLQEADGWVAERYGTWTAAGITPPGA